ncbi:polysaccharide pyruvyl transferase family protein [Ensifer canadensis]
MPLSSAGGNLFQDDDLNFPLKVGAALDCVKRSGKPLAVYAVGTSRDWSPQARQLFGGLEESQLVHISVRDSIAGRNWLGHFPAGPHARILPDPGLLVREIVASHSHEPLKGDDRAIGICVTDPLILRRHSSHGTAGIPFRHAADYHQLLRLMLDAGYRICLFTNGAQEDQAFARGILGGAGLAEDIDSGDLYLAPRPKTPEELVHIIASTQVILAHRLHACIAAYSLGVPQVGLGWDPKVDGFFQFVGRSEYFAGGPGIAARDVAALLEEAARKGIDPAAHASILKLARDGISQLRECLEAPQTRSASPTIQPVVVPSGRGLSGYALSHGL